MSLQIPGVAIADPGAAPEPFETDESGLLTGEPNWKTTLIPCSRQNIVDDVTVHIGELRRGPPNDS